MSVLRSLENKIAGLVEGTFSRAFKSEVRPVEIARKLAREMEQHKSPSVSRTYVPNQYRVYLSPRDRERFTEFEEALAGELSGYLLEYARRERFALLSRPVIEFETDDRLRLGEFGIQTGVAQVTDAPPAPESVPAAGYPYGDGPGAPGGYPPGSPSVGAGGHPRASRPWAAGGQRAGDQPAATMIYGREPAGAPSPPPRSRRPDRAVLVLEGRRLVVGSEAATIGRSRQCEIVVDDPNVSRRHAELRSHAGTWVLTDLGSTNGCLVNGRRINGPEVVRPGDEIELGTSVLKFELE